MPLSRASGATMRRREFIKIIAGSAAAAWPLAAGAQQPGMPVIGFLSSASTVGWENYVAGFHRGLAESGFTEGQNVKIEYRWAQGRYEQLPALAAELARLKVAAIFASGGLVTAQAAKAATSSIPIVFSMGADPVGYGLVDSLNRPGGNMTGLASINVALVSKLFALLAEIAPKASVFGLLVNTDNKNSESEIEEARKAVRALGKTFQLISAAKGIEFDEAFAKFAGQGGQALVVSSDPFFNNSRNQLIALSARHRIPTIYGWPEYPKAEGLASYGPDLSDQYRLCGVYIGRILKGAKPGELPVVQPTKFKFVINLKTARALGITVPPGVMAIADEMIE
jgi:putative tryptophan/tyrosine transport system substrate-binding protein